MLQIPATYTKTIRPKDVEMPLNLRYIFTGTHKACTAFISSGMQEGPATVAKYRRT
jgi:hypothetical protein